MRLPEVFVEALELATSFEAWDRLRTEPPRPALNRPFSPAEEW